MRSVLLALLFVFMASAAHAQKWANFASISPTTNLVTNTLCYSDGRDLACDGAGGLLITSGTVAFSNISATNISVSTINGKTAGSLGVSTLASLTDVSASNPFMNGGILTYIASQNKWAAVSPSQILSTTTMLPKLLDAMVCNFTSPAYGNVYFYHFGDNLYRAMFNNTGDLYITWNTDGTFASYSAASTSNCNISISALYAAGRAFNFIGGSGSNSGVLGDRITSGTLVAVANSATGYISLTTGSTTWGYLSSGVNYLPNVQTSTLSATVISATAIQLVSQTTSPMACNSGNSGTLRYNSPTTTLQLCNGTGWQPMGVGIPAGTISAFASTTCPTGWSEYTAARGRFLRGIDNGAGLDPDGTRGPGGTQADAIQNITGGFKLAGSTGGMDTASGAFAVTGAPTGFPTNIGGNVANVGSISFDASTQVRTAAETRPKNVAVTFCQFNGTSNGWNNPLSGGSTTPGGSTADVQINSGGAFGADSGNFTYSSSTLKAPNVTVSGNVSAATVTVSQNSTGCTSANVGTFRRNPTTNRVEICE